MLEDVYKEYLNKADVVDWKKYNQNELFFECIKHENDKLYENYYAGIVCRFWGYTGRIYSQCNGHITFEQCYDILIDAINYVLQKRVWLNPESSLYQDPVGPDKAFHIALKRQRGILLSSLTTDKRSSNFNTLSIDEMYENYSDSTEGILNLKDLRDDNTSKDIVEMIKSYKDTNVKIVLDQICFGKWNTKSNIENNIKKLNLTDFEYYNKKYDISKSDYIESLKSFIKGGRNKILFDINKSIYLVRGNY